MSAYTFKHIESALITLLRTTLGIIFVWLGLLKVAGYQPSILGMDSLPYFAASGGGLVFGIVEALIGILLLANIILWVTELLLVVYLVGTLLVLLAAPQILFAAGFPQLTAVGELVLKNVAVGIAGIGVLVHEQRQRQLSQKGDAQTE